MDTETSSSESFVPRGLAPFGTGSPGCSGPLRLLANGSPPLGNATFQLQASGLGYGPTALLTSDVAQPTGVRMHYALFHVEPSRVIHHVPLPWPNLDGSLIVPLAIPPDPALAGVTSVLQLVNFFPSGQCARRICSSPGLSLTFQ